MRKNDIDKLCDSMRALNESSRRLLKEAEIARKTAESIAEQAELIIKAYDRPVRPYYLDKHTEVR